MKVWRNDNGDEIVGMAPTGELAETYHLVEDSPPDDPIAVALLILQNHAHTLEDRVHKLENRNRVDWRSHIGFDVVRAEAGGWVLWEYDVHTDEVHRYLCADAAALADQMRAWTERQVVRLHEHVAHAARTEAGPHLAAAREVSA